MSLRFGTEQLAELRYNAQLFVERAGRHEVQLDAFVAATERDLRYAEAAVSRAADDVDVDEVRHLLSAPLERSAAGAAPADAPGF